MAPPVEPPDYEDLPDSSDLTPPTPDQLPLAVLSNQLAIRAIRKEVAAVRKEINSAKAWVVRLVIAVLAGSTSVAVTVVGAAVAVGSGQERIEHHERELERLDSRVRDLERKAMDDATR
jgi:hypothetical protein